MEYKNNIRAQTKGYGQINNDLIVGESKIAEKNNIKAT